MVNQSLLLIGFWVGIGIFAGVLSAAALWLGWISLWRSLRLRFFEGKTDGQ